MIKALLRSLRLLFYTVMAEEVIARFDNVTFEYLEKRPILDGASFSLRRGSKVTLMGQNGAGKSTIFGLLRGDLKPKSGNLSITSGATIGSAKQVIDRADLDLTVEAYFATAFEVVPGNLASRMAKAMEAVNLTVPTDRRVGDLSGGQQARLLLAFALLQSPDILLLDEPTNNLDQAGIDHLIEFLIMYQKTVIVISHDADFLNCFTEGVLYLDVFTHLVEQYVGDYFSVVEQIDRRIERERMKNAQLEKTIQDRKEKVNFFANKGGKMRKLAKKLKDETEELEENKVDVRKEDKTIRDFDIPAQEHSYPEVVKIDSVLVIKGHQAETKTVDKTIHKRSRLLISGPNGMGKSTLLRSLVDGSNPGAIITPGIRVGYYSQDFATLDFNASVYDSLKEVMAGGLDDQNLRSIAAGFLITGELMGRPVAALSEGQKGLLSFARLVLMQPGLLILDEPTNHINFRHIPVIAKAVNEYDGALIFVSHMAEFVKEIKVTDDMDLRKL